MTKPSIDVPGTKRMVISLAAAATIGLWAIFARIERNVTAGEAPANDPEISPVEMQPEFLVNLPPVPTLVPTLAPGLRASGGMEPGGSPAPIPTAGSLLMPTPGKPLVWKAPKDSEGRSKPKPERSGNGGSSGGGASAGSGSSK